MLSLCLRPISPLSLFSPNLRGDMLAFLSGFTVVSCLYLLPVSLDEMNVIFSLTSFVCSLRPFNTPLVCLDGTRGRTVHTDFVT
ncbi:hypothetical protein BJY01DRAFT_132545 [Aspergillus pseudoustus]|uniref:Uncharacterized protein n=1 Tax=Aspergillus pseudoustus TaxID=1810923 RepID=A0ABR4KDG9_9EURO